MGTAALRKAEADPSATTECKVVTNKPPSSSSDTRVRSSNAINGAAARDRANFTPPSSAESDRGIKKVNSKSMVVVHVEPELEGEEGPPRATIAKKLQGLLQQLDEGLTLDPVELRESLSLALTALSDTESSASGSEVEVLNTVTNTQVRAWLATTFTRQEQLTPVPISPLTPKERFKAAVKIIIIGKFFESMLKVSSFAGPIYPAEAATILSEELGAWHFPIFRLNQITMNNVLRVVGYDLFRHYNLFESCSISRSVLDGFLTQIELDYGNYGNPYHNATHGADVAQTVHYFISQTGLKEHISSLDIMALLFSALIHDVNHPGTTNNFQISTKSDLALLYSDRSVLEYHHLHHTFKLMQDKHDLFSGLSSDDYKTIRGLIVEMVLGTDMSFHFMQIKNIRQALTSPNSGTHLLTENRAKTFAFILHVADISHPAKGWAEHEVWSDMLCEEFFCQGDREKSMGIKVSPMCARDSTNLPDSQIGFIDFIVSPAFEVTGLVFDAITELSPNAECAAKSHDQGWVWARCIESNKAQWKEKREILKAEKEAAEAAAAEEGGGEVKEGSESKSSSEITSNGGKTESNSMAEQEVGGATSQSQEVDTNKSGEAGNETTPEAGKGLTPPRSTSRTAGDGESTHDQSPVQDTVSRQQSHDTVSRQQSHDSVSRQQPQKSHSVDREGTFTLSPPPTGTRKSVASSARGKAIQKSSSQVVRSNSSDGCLNGVETRRSKSGSLKRSGEGSSQLINGMGQSSLSVSPPMPI